MMSIGVVGSQREVAGSHSHYCILNAELSSTHFYKATVVKKESELLPRLHSLIPAPAIHCHMDDDSFTDEHQVKGRLTSEVGCVWECAVYAR